MPAKKVPSKKSAVKKAAPKAAAKRAVKVYKAGEDIPADKVPAKAWKSDGKNILPLPTDNSGLYLAFFISVALLVILKVAGCNG